MWIEHRLAGPHLGDALRKELGRLRAKALAGRLTRREFEEVRRQGHATTPPARAVLRALRVARRRLASVPGASGLLAKVDALIQDVERTLEATRSLARLVGLPHLRAARG